MSLKLSSTAGPSSAAGTGAAGTGIASARRPFSDRKSSPEIQRLPRRAGEALPFASAEEAWFWFVQARQAQLDGARVRAGWVRIARPCEPLDLLTLVDRLYRKRCLLREHLMVLAHYGQQQMPPDPERALEAQDARIWAEALAVLTPALRAKGLLQ